MPYYQDHDEHRIYLSVIRDRIQRAIYDPLSELKAEAWVTPEPAPFERRRPGRRIQPRVGDLWGKLWDCAWFHFTGTVPKSAAGRKVVLRIDLNGEACVFDEKGCPVRGLTPANSRNVPSLGNPGKVTVRFLEKARGGEKVDLWVEAGCNDAFGQDLGGTVHELRVAAVNEELRALFYDFAILYELMMNMPREKARYHTILLALSEAAQVMTDFTEAEAKRARAFLAAELAKRGAEPPSLIASAVGHAHLDLAWGWPMRETIRKGSRTFSTALEMMARFPDYHFGASHAQLYQWMKDRYPLLYKKIKKRVAEGRWEAQGAMWVESDVNMPSGESLVRQVLHGKRFFRAEFGKDMKICWLPDCFGFTGALPQILKKAGVDYFLTQKVTWVKFRKYPHDTFFWEGIDGSRVLAHTPPFEHYSSSATPESILAYEKRFSDKMTCPAFLLLFGQGDGGGGAGSEHLEALAREKNLDGMPPVVQETAIDFFHRIEKNARYYESWVGPLDLDRHTGTLTTQALLKKHNRLLEIALRETELAASMALVLKGKTYPAAELDAAWKEMLLHQFHDMLPGTSIPRVHEESNEVYRRLLGLAARLTKQAEADCLRDISTGEARKPVVVSNSLSWDREEWVHLAGQWKKVRVPSMGYAVADLAEKSPVDAPLQASAGILENDMLIVRFNKAGRIVSIFDKENQREALAEGAQGNRMVVYEDMLNQMRPWDKDAWGIENAWDFPVHYHDKAPWEMELKSSAARVEGPRAIVRQVWTVGKSRLEQEIVLASGSRRVDFVTTVDWQERHRMLRASFPVNVRAESATCEIQFGHVRRTTHKNTTWDIGKFESCAHRWADLSQADYGVAILNDCKYGHRLYGNVLDLALLRSSDYPAPEADRGEHHFTYSILPHAGTLAQSNVVREGYGLNMPLRATPVKPAKGALPPAHSFFRVDAENVILETVKKAEDGNDLILRLYEAHGKIADARVEFGFGVKAAAIVDLMEENPQALKIKKNAVMFPLKPFEIVTLRLTGLSGAVV
jgi:alpha-mannosidase